MKNFAPARDQAEALADALLREFSVSHLRHAFFIERSMDNRFAEIGSLVAGSPFREEHIYAWEGMEFTVGKQELSDGVSDD